MKSVGNFVGGSSLFMALLGFGCSPTMPVGDAAPALRAVAPAAGPTAGGFELSLDGDNFEAGARVTVGGVEAEQVSVTSPTHLTAILPANPGRWGNVELTVTNPDGQLATRGDLFSYYASQPEFAGTVFVGSRRPGSILVSDFNRDQAQDLVLVNSASDTVGLFLGNGHGGFSAASSIVAGPAGAPLQSGVTADFNGDGNLDLAVTSNQSSVSVSLGDGRGRFAQPFHFNVGLFPSQLAFADFNGDRKLDLVVTHSETNDNVSVLFGDGEGGFAAPMHLTVGTSPWDVAVGDFNGDSKTDIAVTDADAKIHVLIGDGKGGFSDITTTLEYGTHPGMLTVGDFNRDHKLDLAVLPLSQNNVMILLGDGLGGFSSLNTFPTGQRPGAITLGDFNGDKLEDLAIANGKGGSVSVLLGNGKGTFSTAKILAVSDGPKVLAAGDFNGDAKLDLAVGSDGYGDANLGSLSVWLNQSK